MDDRYILQRSYNSFRMTQWYVMSIQTHQLFWLPRITFDTVITLIV